MNEIDILRAKTKTVGGLALLHRQGVNKMKTEEYLLPAWTLSALINDDYSGLEDADEKSLEAFLERGVAEHGTFFALCPEEVEPSFYRSNDLNNLGDNCLIITFCVGE